MFVAGVLLGSILTLPSVADAQGITDPAPGFALEVSPPAFSPNGDGRMDGTVVLVRLGAVVELTLRVLGPEGEVVRVLLDGELTGPGEVRAPWSGDAVGGELLPDGDYVIRGETLDALGDTMTVEATVVLDTRAPRVRRLSVEPDPYRGHGRVRFSFRALDHSPTMTTTALVEDPTGHRLAALPRTDVGRGRVDLRWDGLDARGRAPVPGLRSVTVRVRDEAGNIGFSAPRAFRDHRPVSTHVIRRVDGAGNRVALTFDDCYDATAWERILDTLDDGNAAGSFFCLGPYVLANPRLAARTVAEGHDVGAHGWDHSSAASLSRADLRSRVRREAAAWWDVAGVTPVPFYRPVGGEYDAHVLRAVGLEGFGTVVLWDVDPWDWSRPGPTAISQRVLGHVRGGSIVVLHTIGQTAAALPAIVSGLRARGLEPVTLSELLRASE